MGYTIDRVLTGVSFEEAEARTRAALAENGFGVITEIDVAATMKKKLDRDMAAYKILGACHPGHAFAAIEASPRIGAMLPCNVMLRAIEGGVEVSAVDPVASFAAVEEAGARKVAEDVRAIYAAMMDKL